MEDLDALLAFGAHAENAAADGHAPPRDEAFDLGDVVAFEPEQPATDEGLPLPMQLDDEVEAAQFEQLFALVPHRDPRRPVQFEQRSRA